jgi:hypothetical protein
MGKSKTKAAPTNDVAKSTKVPKPKTPAVAVDNAAVSHEIDALFSKAKKPKAEPANTPQTSEVVKVKKPRRSEAELPYGIMKSENGGEIVNPEAPLERIDPESGLPVYKAHLLKVGEGGGTPLCPFDCNCCF